MIGSLRLSNWVIVEEAQLELGPGLNVLTGETGTGKELVANAIHKLSPRSNDLFVPLNCSAIPSELLESELFGHVRGAFSGARADRAGKFQVADGGTLFLDEIGDMEQRLQSKLLRVLQEGVIEPIGSNRRIPVDVRVVSSTHRDLERAIQEGEFREDLFYRLNVFRIELPPLTFTPKHSSKASLSFSAGKSSRGIKLSKMPALPTNTSNWPKARTVSSTAR